jgi:hypothetical protein
LLGPGAPAIDAHFTAPDQPENAAARYSNEPLCEQLVQTLALAFRVDLHVPDGGPGAGCAGLFGLGQLPLQSLRRPLSVCFKYRLCL